MSNIRVEPSDEEIYDALNKCVEAANNGTSIYPGMNYEDGVKAAIEWLIGDTKDKPF
jgi:hypothetical protein